MVRLLVGTDGVETSQSLREYLRSALGPDDGAVVVNSLVGGDGTDEDDVAAGSAALEVFEGATGVVETHQFVRGNEPVEDLLASATEFDADEYVIGVRKRSPVGKMVFGSTAQNLLLEADRPVRCVPLVSD